MECDLKFTPSGRLLEKVLISGSYRCLARFVSAFRGISPDLCSSYKNIELSFDIMHAYFCVRFEHWENSSDIRPHALEMGCRLVGTAHNFVEGQAQGLASQRCS